MQVTFLVTLEVDGDYPLLEIAQDLLDDIGATHNVIEVKPWARPTMPETQTGIPPVSGI